MPRLSVLPRLALLPLLLGAAAASDDYLPPEELETDHALTFAIATPHVAWARPYAGGRTRVLFLTRGMGLHPRECVELMQRFDLDAKAAFYEKIIDSQDMHWHGGKSGVERLRKLIAEPWDAFVIAGGVTLDKLDNESQFKLLERVADGAGLVLVGADDARVLLPGHRIDEPWATAGGGGTAFVVGKGRALRLPARPNIPYHEDWRAKDETWQEAYGRGLLWAARKEPACRLQIAAPGRVNAAGTASFTLSASGPADPQARLELAIRRPHDPPLPLLAPAWADRMEATCSRLPAGDYHLDARVVGPAGVLTWATAAFTVVSPRTVASPGLAATWAEPGGRLAGTVVLAGPPQPDERVRVRLLDPQRRELARQDLAAGLAYDFRVEDWLPMLVTVEAQVLRGGEELAAASAYFNVCKRGRDRFNFLMWDYPNGTLAPYAQDSLVRNGITLQLSQGNPPPHIAASGVSWVPYTTRMTATRDAAQGMKLGPVDWNDEAAVARHTAELVKKYEPARRHGVFVYSLGDENDTLGCTTTTHDLAAYRTFLRGRYAGLAELNATWGTAFADWDAVGLSAPDDNEEAAALAAGNHPRWFDRQAFKSWNYLRVCSAYRKAFATLDPQARTGFEGAGEFAKGDDLDGIVQAMDFWSPYPGTADEVAASIAPRSMPRANWMGYTKDADSLLGKYWRMVMLGMDAAWWWRWDAIGRFHGWLAPDLRPYPAVQEILDDTRLVRQGVGDLMLRSERQHDGIAILYSYPSTFASRLGEKAATYEPVHKRALRILRDLGLEPRYVTDGMLRRDPAALKPYHTLLLVRADALGEADAAAIRAFAAGGGKVIADLRPGVFDGRLAARPAGALDGLFGVQAPAGLRRLGAGTGLSAGATAQRAADGAPLRIATGGCELLNADLMSKPGEEALRAALSAHSHTARFAVAGPDGKRPDGLWIQRWRQGSIEILGVLAADVRIGEHTMYKDVLTGPSSLPVTITLPEAAMAYDLRAGTALGRTTTLQAVLRPNRVNLYALMPAAPPAPQWTGPAATVAPGTLLRLQLGAPGSPGLRPFRIMASLDGHELTWTARTVLAGADAVAVEQPIAFNDPVGTWRFTARDQLTGQTTTIDVRIGGQ